MTSSKRQPRKNWIKFCLFWAKLRQYTHGAADSTMYLLYVKNTCLLKFCTRVMGPIKKNLVAYKCINIYLHGYKNVVKKCYFLNKNVFNTVDYFLDHIFYLSCSYISSDLYHVEIWISSQLCEQNPRRNVITRLGFTNIPALLKLSLLCLNYTELPIEYKYK